MMLREVGDKNFPIWLLGDSEPKQWIHVLDTPLDPRHPVRHNIWTSIADVIQDEVFRAQRSRVDTSSLYIRNAVGGPLLSKPPSNALEWPEVESAIQEFKKSLTQYTPQLILPFGAFAFEFARRAQNESPPRKYAYWSALRLGEEFRQRISQFQPDTINLVPLLHRVISGGKFIQAHTYFCNEAGANYFEHVGKQLADQLLEHRSALPIWIE